jgi:hypothetical protein
MKLSYIITCHKNAQQVFRLIKRLQKSGSNFVIHVSKTSEGDLLSELKNLTKEYSNVFFCKQEDGTHNGFGIVKGIFNGIEYLFKNNIYFDYVNLISGQDYPIKDNHYIDKFFIKNNGKQFLEYYPVFPKPGSEFYDNHPWGPHRQVYRVDRYHFKFTGVTRSIPELNTNRLIDHPLFPTIKIFLHEARRYYKEKRLKTEFLLLFWSRVLPHRRKIPENFEIYGGKTWWSITKECAQYVLESYHNDHIMRKFFKYTLIPDEMYVLTIILNSKFRDSCVNDCIREIEWEGGDGTHPIIFTVQHKEKLSNSTALFARKFDICVDKNILDYIDNNLLDK